MKAVLGRLLCFTAILLFIGFNISLFDFSSSKEPTEELLDVRFTTLGETLSQLIERGSTMLRTRAQRLDQSLKVQNSGLPPAAGGDNELF